MSEPLQRVSNIDTTESLNGYRRNNPDFKILGQLPAALPATFPHFEHMTFGELIPELRKYNPDASCWMCPPDRTGWAALESIGEYKGTGLVMTLREFLFFAERHLLYGFSILPPDHWPVDRFTYYADEEPGKPSPETVKYRNAAGHVMFFAPLCKTAVVRSGDKFFRVTARKIRRDEATVEKQELLGYTVKHDDGSVTIHGSKDDLAMLIAMEEEEESKAKELAAVCGGSCQRMTGYGIGSVSEFESAAG